MLAEAGERVIIYSETSPVPTTTERPLSQKEAITPKVTLKRQIAVCKCTQRQRP